MKEQEIEKMLTIISVANTVGNPYVDQKIAEALWEAGYRNVKNMKLISDEEIKSCLEDIQTEGFNWSEITDSEWKKYRAVAQAQHNR